MRVRGSRVDFVFPVAENRPVEGDGGFQPVAAATHQVTPVVSVGRAGDALACVFSPELPSGKPYLATNFK